MANFSRLEIVSRDVNGVYMSLDLLSANKVKVGLGLIEWKPSLPPLKSGGIYQQSSLADGQQLVDSRYENAFEQMSLLIAANSQDDAIAYERILNAFLIKARNYWTSSFEHTVVFLKAQAAHESQTRYALIMNYTLTDEGMYNPYAQPFFNDCAAIMNEVSLVIERGDWLDNEPGRGACVLLAGEYTDSNAQVTPTCNEIFIQNTDQRAEITHIFTYDADTATFSANLVNSTGPFNLLPAVPAAGDALYIGIDSTILFTGTFSNVVFNIGTPAGAITAEWQYYPNPWTAFPADAINDNTAALDNAGTVVLAFVRPSDWMPTLINGVTAWWIRLYVSAVTVATPPTQGSGKVYTGSRAGISIAQGEIKGDIPAYARIKIRNYGGSYPDDDDTLINSVIWGTRSASRGTYFSPFLTATDSYATPMAGVTTFRAGTGVAVMTDPQNATARRTVYYPTTVESLNFRMGWRFTSLVAMDYLGRYHAYARVEQAGGEANDFTMQLRCSVATAGNASSTEPVSVGPVWPGTLTGVGLVDLGVITIPFSDVLYGEDTLYSMYLMLYISNSNAFPGSLWVQDVILMPVDEFYGMSYNPNAQTVSLFLDQNLYLDIDSISYPKRRLRSVLRAKTNDYIWNAYTPLIADNAKVQANAAQTIWFLTSRIRHPDYIPASTPSAVYSIQLYSQSRYLGMRGAT